MELNGVNSYYTGYAQQPARLIKTTRHQEQLLLIIIQILLPLMNLLKARLFHLLHQNQPILL